MKTQEIIKQLKILGIECQENTWLSGGTFPGCTIQEGTLIYNPNRVTVEALLHEAGHIAVCPTRKFLSGWNINQDSNENAAIAVNPQEVDLGQQLLNPPKTSWQELRRAILKPVIV